MSLLKAILIAPLSQIVVTATYAVFFGIMDENSFKEILFSSVTFLIFTTAIAYLVTILLGVPVHLWLKSRMLSTVKNHAIAGVLTGIIAALILTVPHTTVSYVSYTPLVFLSSLIVATTFGAITGSQTPANIDS